MSDATATPATVQTDRAAWKQAALMRQAERLEQLAEAGLRLALTLEAEAAEARAAGQPVRDDAAMAYSRVSRAVRMGVLLHARLLQDMDAAVGRGLGLDAKVSDTRVSDAEAERLADEEARLDPAYGHKARVEAIVERVVRAHTDDEDRADRLVIEAGERLDDDDIYGEVLTRPVGELVALICRDLGLTPDWDRLSREAWAQAEIAAAPPGSPFLSTEARTDPLWRRSSFRPPPSPASPPPCAGSRFP